MAKFQLKPRDRGAYKEHPMVVPHMTLDEYGPKLKDFFTFKRSDNGILEAKWHTQGKELLWSVQVHRAIWQACMYIGQDMDNEVLILGGKLVIYDYYYPPYDNASSGYSRLTPVEGTSFRMPDNELLTFELDEDGDVERVKRRSDYIFPKEKK